MRTYHLQWGRGPVLPAEGGLGLGRGSLASAERLMQKSSHLLALETQVCA